jgi:hypothetical protein
MADYYRTESSCNNHTMYRNYGNFQSLYFADEIEKWAINSGCGLGGVKKVFGSGAHEPYVEGGDAENDWQCYSNAESAYKAANLTVMCTEAECPEKYVAR